MRLKVLGFLLLLFTITSCSNDPTICKCYKNSRLKEPKAGMSKKCDKMQKDWAARYEAGSDTVKKSMDLEFNTAIKNCK